jgi:hypothetical protein
MKNETGFGGANKATAAAFVILLLAAGVLYWFELNRPSQPVPSEAGEAGLSPTEASQEKPEVMYAAEPIYFAKAKVGQTSFIDLRTGEVREDVIPAGYTIESQHSYGTNPPYLILSQDRRVFVFNVVNETIEPILDGAEALRLLENEKIMVVPSITDPERFFFDIGKYDPNAVWEMMPPQPLSARSFLYDAAENRLTFTSSQYPRERQDRCAVYDSKNERFFLWLCGEGIGSSIPLSMRNLDGSGETEVVSLEDFGLVYPRDVGSIAVYGNKSRFILIVKGGLVQLITVDPLPATPTTETYVVSETDMIEYEGSLTNIAYPYSVTIDEESKTIVVGMSDEIRLFRFDDERLIVAATTFPESERFYPNFTFLFRGILYYQTNDAIRGVDLNTWETVVSVPSVRGEEISVFFLPD